MIDSPAIANAPAHSALCQICGKIELVERMTLLSNVRPAVTERIERDYPRVNRQSLVCKRHVMEYRSLYVQEILREEKSELNSLDASVVESIERSERAAMAIEKQWEPVSFGQRCADIIATFGGSWTFISLFILAGGLWIVANISALSSFDPYPFILLNLCLSCLAALQAPIIMMSQNRQEARDRMQAENDYKVNLKAELEIRHLHEKLDHLLSRQWERLAEIQQIQIDIMHDFERLSTGEDQQDKN